jgi:hypothetical protein
MSKTLTLLKEMIEEDKITIQEVLEACGYEVEVVCTDAYNVTWDSYNETWDVYEGKEEILIGYDEKIVATKEFR